MQEELDDSTAQMAELTARLQATSDDASTAEATAIGHLQAQLWIAESTKVPEHAVGDLKILKPSFASPQDGMPAQSG